MGAKFEFRGNLLYRFLDSRQESDSGVKEILLPLCKKNSENDTHEDSSPKRIHFPGIMIEKDVNPKWATFIDLENADSVTIGTGTAIAEFEGHLKANLPWLGALGEINRPAVACSVSVRGDGTWLRRQKDEENNFSFATAESKLSLSYEFVMTAKDTLILVTYKGTNEVQPFIVHEDERAFVYSSDIQNPTRASLYRDEKVEKDAEDLDFKWLYGLFANGKGLKVLPAPKNTGGRMVNVSTCFPGGGG